MEVEDYEKAHDLVRAIRQIGYELNIWEEFVISPSDLYYTDPLKHQGGFCPLGTSINKEEFLEIRNFAISILNRKKVKVTEELEKL